MRGQSALLTSPMRAASRPSTCSVPVQWIAPPTIKPTHVVRHLESTRPASTPCRLANRVAFPNASKENELVGPHLLKELAQHALRPLLRNHGGLDCGGLRGMRAATLIAELPIKPTRRSCPSCRLVRTAHQAP